MGSEERERKLRSVNAHRETFVIAAPNGKYKMLRRLGRKLTFWYVQPFGEEQNQFNAAAADLLSSVHTSLSAIEERLSSLETQIERRVFAFTQAQRKSLAQTQSTWDERFDALRGEIDRSLCSIAPENRLYAGESFLNRLPQIGTESLYPEIHDVQNALTPEELQGALETLTASYTALLRENLQKGLAQPTARPVVLVCRCFGDDADSAEVWAVSRLFHRACRYPVCIASLEKSGNAVVKQGDVYTVPEECLAEWLQEQSPALLIVCARTPELLFAGGGAMLLRNSLVRVTGQEPLRGLGAERLQELLHLCDSGVHRYCTASEHAAELMEQRGFRRPAVRYLYADADRMLYRRPRTFDAAKFTVGVAADAVSFQLLREVLRQNPKMRFLVLPGTRTSLPNKLRSAENCELFSGDTAAFYAQIDCMLHSLTGTEDAADCPQAVFDGMRMGLPVVSTPDCGIAELIEKTGLGSVTERADADALTAALRELAALYPAYQTGQGAELLRQTISAQSIVPLAEQCIEENAPAGVRTLSDWEQLLTKAGGGLVRGAAAIKAHYQRPEAAENYTEQRFGGYPHSCFDAMERASVRVLLEQMLTGRESPVLLDAACGDGRMLQCLLPLGRCTAADSSPAMLMELRRRYPQADVQLAELDLFTDELPEQYDVITCFRMIRHYGYADRRVLWARLREALKPDGVLLFDAPNIRCELPLREKNGWQDYAVYDVFWTREAIMRELADNGLRAAAIVPVGAGLYPLPGQYRGEPASYTVLAIPAE